MTARLMNQLRQSALALQEQAGNVLRLLERADNKPAPVSKRQAKLKLNHDIDLQVRLRSGKYKSKKAKN